MYNIYEIKIDDHLPLDMMVCQKPAILMATSTLVELKRNQCESVALKEQSTGDIFWANINVTCPNAHIVQLVKNNKLAISCSYRALELLMSKFNQFLPTDTDVIDTLYN